MQSALETCWLKIERAKEHRDALQRHIAQTFAVEANRPRLAAKLDPESGEHILFVNQMPDFGDFTSRCAIVTGDVAHNLISSLNQLAYQLAVLHSGESLQFPNRIDFPIADAPDRFQELKKRCLSEIDPAHVTIIERYQGYHRIDAEHGIVGGSYFHPLSLLRDLASTDKHRVPIELIMPTSLLQGFDWSDFGSVIFELMREFAMVGDPAVRPIERGAELARVRLPGANPEVDMAGYVTPSVTIAQGHPIIPVIDKIAAVIVKIVREFEPFF